MGKIKEIVVGYQLIQWFCVVVFLVGWWIFMNKQCENIGEDLASVLRNKVVVVQVEE